MRIIKRVFLYVVVLLHIPITIVRAVVSTTLLVDLWCDKVIDKWLNDVDKELNNEELFCQKVIHHKCKWFDEYNGCIGCLVKKYEPKSAESTSK